MQDRSSRCSASADPVPQAKSIEAIVADGAKPGLRMDHITSRPFFDERCILHLNGTSGIY